MKLTGINQLWVADITYIRLHREFVYLAVILDSFLAQGGGLGVGSNAGGAAADGSAGARHRGTAAAARPGASLRSRRAVCVRDYVTLLRKHQMLPSMSRPANPYDNASCESFMRTLKREEIYANEYRDLDDLRANIEEFIERYYNRIRLHSALGYRPPEEFEQAARLGDIFCGGEHEFFQAWGNLSIRWAIARNGGADRSQLPGPSYR